MKTWVLLMTLILLAGNSLAKDTAKVHFEKKMEFKRGVIFEHTLHTDTYGFGCLSCHESMAGGKIQGFGKEWSHKICLGCHEELKWAPTICEGCHDKGIRGSKWQLFKDSIVNIFK